MTHLRQVKNELRERFTKKGNSSVLMVVLCLIGLVLFCTMFQEIQNTLIIRNLEATADLAAVESLRKYIDEDALRNEYLQITTVTDPLTGDVRPAFKEIRNDFLKKIRENKPGRSYKILRIEIPTVSNGNIDIPDNYSTYIFPNSYNEINGSYVDGGADFIGPDLSDPQQERYYLGGDSTGTSAISIVKDYSGLATSGTGARTSYIMTADVTVIYKSSSFLNRVGFSLVKYTDIFSGNVKQLKTQQLSDGTTAVTLQVIGKVTLR